MTLGENINSLRKKQGMSQEQLAYELNVSRQSISKWELGESVPELEKIVALAKLFSVSTDELIKGGEDNEANSSSSDSLTPIIDTVKRRWYRIGYLLIGWGILGAAGAGFVRYLWTRMWPDIPQLPSHMRAALYLPVFIMAIGIAAALLGLVIVIRGNIKARHH